MKNPNLVDSPISQAITLSRLKQSDNPIGGTLSNISSAIAEISGRLAKIEQKTFADEKTATYPILKIHGQPMFESKAGELPTTIKTIDWDAIIEKLQKKQKAKK